MSDQLPSPEFDRTKYERPNDAWVCGHACAGKPCRLGPSSGGDCRVGGECRPVLDKNSGQEKGRWRCTRAPAHGGPCADGPAPDGTCGSQVPPCVPHRSLRRVRHLFTLVAVAISCGLLLVAISGEWRWRVISPNTVSQVHQGSSFNRIAHESLGGANQCGACHEAANAGLRTWIQGAIEAHPGPLDRQQFQVLAAGVVPMTSIDQQSCSVCHDQKQFHQPNVVEANSCTTCHVEHRGLKMLASDDLNCARCHNRVEVMTASSVKGTGLPSAQFDPPAKPGVRAFRTPRPAGGRTNLITSFGRGHPNFGLLAQGLKDPDTLRFNHAMHLGDTVRLKNGQPLDCASCHVADSTGAYMARIQYSQHCAPCHDLQFDPVHPELRLPHADVSAVRAKLRGLPVIYAELKTRQLAAAGKPPLAADIDTFAQENLARMRSTFGGGEGLERLVLFTGDPRERQPGLTAERRAHYAGCAYCHEVTPDHEQLARVSPLSIPDRWLLNGRFDHGKHTMKSCQDCHGVRTSHSTADINLPTQASCAVCHSPGQGAPSGCATCHTYHLGLAN